MKHVLHFVSYFANLCQIVSYDYGECTMATMNISLPDQMKEWVEAQSESGRYSNASDYVRDLIRRDQERETKITVFQASVTAGIESGISSRSIKEVKAEARKRAGIGSA